MTLAEMFTAAAIAANWTEAASNKEPYLGSAMWPNRQKRGLDLRWILGNKGVPISLMPTAFDAEPTFRDRIGIERVETEMPFFREGFLLGERDRQELLRISESNDPYADDVLARIYDDANNLVDAAEVVAERMRMQLLFPDVSGSNSVGISIKANGVDYTYNYDPSGDWKTNNYFALTGTALWSQPTTADPFKDFRTVKNAIRSQTGTELVRAVMNSTTFAYLENADSVKNRFLTVNGMAVGTLAEGDVKSVISRTTGIGIVLYDKQYKDENKVSKNFVPDGYVAFVPNGTLGNTWRGTTPEEADLRARTGADVSIVNNGVAITRTITDGPPVGVRIYASEIVLPSYERMNEVALMKVA